ncbi:hypothetical protein F5X96DRAFT_96185 [Biscogniauxia mediterranea]|nr:hypothetical protein F5X96DRAFT_96185 [Biscogniauxia mediterranea]
MVKKPATKVPDAWEDDDWEAQADKAATTGESEPATESQAKLSKKERLAQHAELNRKLWESAESPPPNFHYLASRSDPPLASTFKPAVTVLSRRPTPQLATRRPDDPNNPNGAARDDDDDDDDENPKKVQLSPEEIRAKQLREREEKQRRYDEARAKIFGTSNTGSGSGGGAGASVAASNPSSGTSTPGTVTPPRPSADGRGQRGRGRGRGGGYRYNNENRGDRDRDGNQRPGSQSGGSGRELYDPNYSPKPGFQLERRGGGSSGGVPLSGRSTPRDDDQVIRTPRGPDGSTRGFARRGAKTG